MDLNKTLKSYLEELSSNLPTPGGGNVAALCGALASSLGLMVCNLTIGKKKYLQYEEELVLAKEKLTEFSKQFIHFAGQDNEAFDKVIDAYKLPKETDEEKILRSQAIENATTVAAEIPSEVIILCREVIPFIKTLFEKGNQNSLSDAGVAATLISAAAQSAFLNVVINCSALINQTFANEMLKTNEIYFNEVKQECDLLISEIIKKMRPR